MSCEFLTAHQQSLSAKEILQAMRAACATRAKVTHRYEGLSDLLMVWGAGSPDNANAVHQQRKRGKHAICWDYGYFSRAKRDGYLRVSIDDWHPQSWLDKTHPDPSRWNRHGIELREDMDPEGHIILVGLGPKSHKFLRSNGWEERKLVQLQARFPGRRIVYRPKPGRSFTPLQCETVTGGTIESLLQGASLVVCRHSNVGVDAAVAGVHFECEDGAAQWLTSRPFTRENRLDFLRRLSWWQWHSSEAVSAWAFLRSML